MQLIHIPYKNSNKQKKNYNHNKFRVKSFIELNTTRIERTYLKTNTQLISRATLMDYNGKYDKTNTQKTYTQ